jgi:multidrug efflux pump
MNSTTLIFKNINETDVKVKDIGEAVLVPKTKKVLKESNIPMIAIAVIPQPGTAHFFQMK